MTNLFDLVNYSYTVVKMLWAYALSGFFQTLKTIQNETLTAGVEPFGSVNSRGVL